MSLETTLNKARSYIVMYQSHFLTVLLLHRNVIEINLIAFLCITLPNLRKDLQKIVKMTVVQQMQFILSAH